MLLTRQIVISLGIALILPVLVHTGVSVFQPVPKSSSYIEVRRASSDAPTKEERKTIGEERERQEIICDEALRQFARTLNIVAVVAGIASIFVGAHTQIQAIGTGLILGGFFATSLGYIYNWYQLSNETRFISLLAMLAILLFLGMRRTAGRQMPDG